MRMVLAIEHDDGSVETMTGRGMIVERSIEFGMRGTDRQEIQVEFYEIQEAP